MTCCSLANSGPRPSPAGRGGLQSSAGRPLSHQRWGAVAAWTGAMIPPHPFPSSSCLTCTCPPTRATARSEADSDPSPVEPGIGRPSREPVIAGSLARNRGRTTDRVREWVCPCRFSVSAISTAPAAHQDGGPGDNKADSMRQRGSPHGRAHVHIFGNFKALWLYPANFARCPWRKLSLPLGDNRPV